MNIEEIREYCLRKPATEETLPFGDDTLVFKVMGKMFALISISSPDSVNLKCEPEYAAELREKYDSVRPGYHMNKKYWNTVELNSDAADDFIYRLIDHSYDEVVKGLPRKAREELSAVK
jgi:predicted DNA-binding protein (MmcQ/YjbR family)